MTDWKNQVQIEFELAKNARSQGNEGRARVCARRAAGIAIREYYARRGVQVRTPSVLDLLKRLANESQLSQELLQSIDYLTLRVDKEFKLPGEVDLLEEARKLIGGLLNEKSSKI